MRPNPIAMPQSPAGFTASNWTKAKNTCPTSAAEHNQGPGGFSLVGGRLSSAAPAPDLEPLFPPPSWGYGEWLQGAWHERCVPSYSGHSLRLFPEWV